MARQSLVNSSARLLISEILQKVHNAKTKKEKVGSTTEVCLSCSTPTIDLELRHQRS